MGILSAKCPNCWDPIPCNCDAEKERSYGRSPAEIQNELLREQNELLRELVSNARKIARRKTMGKTMKRLTKKQEAERLETYLGMCGYDPEDSHNAAVATFKDGIEAGAETFKWANDKKHDYQGEMRDNLTEYFRPKILPPETE